MENLKEIITQFFQSPEMTALVSAVITYLTANLGTIIVMAVKLIKAKNKEIKEKATSNQVIEALTAEYNTRIENLSASIDAKLDKLDKHVTAKLDEQEEIKKEMIKEQSLQLEEAIKETKKSLNIDEILNQ